MQTTGAYRHRAYTNRLRIFLRDSVTGAWGDWRIPLEIAADRSPGGVRGMVHFAGLSRDARARAVAQAWRAQCVSARRGFSLIGLCDDAGISDGEFFACAVATAFELGILVPLSNSADSFKGAIQRAMSDPSFLTLDDSAHYRERPIAIPEGQRLCGVLAARSRWGLSQSQFADLFMTSVRTVRRWEAGLSALTTHQQFFLRLFVMYIERNGVRAFRRRFVREPATVREGRTACRARVYTACVNRAGLRTERT